MLPAVKRGAARGRRALDDFAISIKPLIATAPDERTLALRVRDVRARIAFYASTPAYRPAFAAHGLGDLADRLKDYSRAQKWADMPGFIGDEVLHEFACVAVYDEIGDLIARRYGGLVSNVEFSIPVGDAADAEVLRGLVARLRAA
jgi:hypothetical protein